MDVTDEQYISYARRLKAHIKNVSECMKNFPAITEEQYRYHDASKWGDEEFTAYAIYFFPTPEQENTPEIKDNFNLAWLHHIHHNPHHWQHWIIPATDIVLKIPDKYAYEMVADWMGAEVTYNNSNDMTGWLTKHYPNIVLHSDTRKLVDNILKDIGYNLDEIYNS